MRAIAALRSFLAQLAMTCSLCRRYENERRHSEERLSVAIPLELNSFSCSGLYACDLGAVVRVAAAAARDAWESH
jgi:hypothetical protein